MTFELPTRKYRKGKEVYMWHLAGNRVRFSVAIHRENEYWRLPSWGHRYFRKLERAIAYAKALAEALENGQEEVQVIGSVTYHRILLTPKGYLVE